MLLIVKTMLQLLVIKVELRAIVNKLIFQMIQKKNNIQNKLMLQFKKDNLNQHYKMNSKKCYLKLYLDNHYQQMIVNLLLKLQMNVFKKVLMF